jgi:ABC-type Na+ efflux pump permease subunit
MKMGQVGIRENLRRILVLAWKDVVDALKNKSILLVALVTIALFGAYKMVPMLWNLGVTEMVVFDAGNSALTTVLEESTEFEIRRTTSFAMFMDYLRDGDEGAMGLIIPAGFDDATPSGENAELRAYILWEHRSSTAHLKQEYEERLESITARPISIRVVGNVVPEVDSMGAVRVASLSFVMAIFFIGMLTIPHLFLEEKRTRTLDSLLISPVSIPQIVLSKAMAGILFVLVAASIVMIFNRMYVVHWGLVFVSIISSASLAVSVGLALGTYIEHKQQLGIWVMILAQVLLVPVFLSTIDPLFSEGIRKTLSYFPTVALTLLFRYAFTSGADAMQISTSLGIVAASFALVMGLVIWKVRREIY